MHYPSIPHPYVVHTYFAFTPLVTFRLRLKFVYLPHSPPLPPTPPPLYACHPQLVSFGGPVFYGFYCSYVYTYVYILWIGSISRVSFFFYKHLE